MHARISRLEASAERLDEMARQFEQETLPQLQEIDGFKGYQLLGDRASGTALAMVFWESADAMQASEEVGKAARQQAANLGEARSAPSVERYEVVSQQL